MTTNAPSTNPLALRRRLAILGAGVLVLSLFTPWGGSTEAIAEAAMPFTGTVDATGDTGPRWTSTIFTPEVSGPDVLTLDWEGSANLRFDVRLAATNEWVGANTSTNQPKTIEATLVAGTGYRVAVWSMSGAAAFNVTSGAVVPPDDPNGVEGRPVILISVDGLRSSILETADVPTWHRLTAEGATTLNARTAVEFTRTLPNHTTMFTGRGVSGPTGHGVDFDNDDGTTVHAAANQYVASIFDAVHDAGMATSFYTQKEKMAFFDRSWDETNGAVDTNGDDNGRDKIDVFARSNAAAMVAALTAELSSDPAELTIIHFGETDFAGHDHGWTSPEYMEAAELVDAYIGDIMDAITDDPALADAVVIMTADHGGTGTSHADSSLAVNYTIPFAVWGGGVTAGADLYEINPNRADPGTTQPPYSGVQPIRNGDAANLITELHGLAPVTGSTINPTGDLRVSGGTTPLDGPPNVGFIAPENGDTVTGTVSMEAAADDDHGVQSVAFLVDGSEVGTDEDGADGWTTDWDTTTTADGSHELTAVATDTIGQTTTDSVDVTISNGEQSEVIFADVVDSTNTAAKRWVSTVYTATSTGPQSLTLDWAGSANLRIDVRTVSNNQWVGANTSTAQPKVVNVNLTAGITYRIAVWSMSGAAEFTVTGT